MTPAAARRPRAVAAGSCAAGLGVALAAVQTTRDDARVRVPGVRFASPYFAYERLHDAGLRVALPDGLRSMSLPLALEASADG